MSQQLIINVSSPTIMTSLRRVLNSMEGVSVERVIRKKESANTTDNILSDEATMASIRRGEKDIAEGRSVKMTASEIRSMLGV